MARIGFCLAALLLAAAPAAAQCCTPQGCQPCQPQTYQFVRHFDQTLLFPNLYRMRNSLVPVQQPYTGAVVPVPPPPQVRYQLEWKAYVVTGNDGRRYLLKGTQPK
jgi:hypothetical protein